MNTASGTITGILAIALGFFLILFGLSVNLWVLIYGIPIFIIGFFILFNKKEDVIEEIKNNKFNDKK